jgi:hypothetical protein
MREARTYQRFSRIKLDTPGPWQYRSLNPQSKLSASQHSVTSDVDADARRSIPLSDQNPDDGSSNTEMTLADIADYSLRSMVGQFIAVAPALPVRDLYHLIIDAKGHLPSAKEQAIRISKVPASRLQFVRLSTFRPPPIEEDEDGDEVMVKLDPNDSAFEYDTDKPPLPEPAPKTKPKSRSKPNSKPPIKHIEMADDELHLDIDMQPL